MVLANVTSNMHTITSPTQLLLRVQLVKEIISWALVSNELLVLMTTLVTGKINKYQVFVKKHTL